MSPPSDVDPSGSTGPSFEPWPEAEVHLEHGHEGAALAAARGDLVVVVDVLSFSTTVSIAIERGAAVLSLSNTEIEELGGREAVATRYEGHVVAKRRDDTTARFTLSPASLARIEANDRLILTSLNGALMVAATKEAPAVLIGSLRSASATARRVDQLLADDVSRRVTVVAAAEHWSSVAPGRRGIRFAVEDLLGAGSIAAGLAAAGRSLSIEAAIGADLFEARTGDLAETLADSISGRELIARGFGTDVELAGRLDATDLTASRDRDGFFR